ncbi:MAG: DUF2798 domain-containing protein [Nitrososphaera sp.]
MSAIMAFVISFFMVLVNIGFGSTFLEIWMRSFIVALVIAFPLSIVSSKFAKRIVEKMT